MSYIGQLRDVEVDEWQDVYAHAVATGSGALPPDEERVSAPDELLAEALPRLVRLGAAVGAGIHIRQPMLLAREAAASLRLLDRALSHHGRDEATTQQPGASKQ